MLETLFFLCRAIFIGMTKDVIKEDQKPFVADANLPSLTGLHDDVIYCLALYLNKNDTAALACTCSKMHTLFNSERNSISTIQKLQSHVVAGEQSQVTALLSTLTPSAQVRLLQIKKPFTDLSLRKFNAMSVFQYALWAGDWHMYTMLKSFMPDNVAAQQLVELELSGSEYGKRYNVDSLFAAYNHFIDFFDANYPGMASLTIRDAMRAELYKIGIEQRECPAHLIQHLYHPQRAFEPCPDFASEVNLPRVNLKSMTRLYPVATSDWGVRFILTRGDNKEVMLNEEDMPIGLRSGCFDFAELARYQRLCLKDYNALVELERVGQLKYAEFKASLLSASCVSDVNVESDARRAASGR